MFLSLANIPISMFTFVSVIGALHYVEQYFHFGSLHTVRTFSGKTELYSFPFHSEQFSSSDRNLPENICWFLTSHSLSSAKQSDFRLPSLNATALWQGGCLLETCHFQLYSFGIWHPPALLQPTAFLEMLTSRGFQSWQNFHFLPPPDFFCLFHCLETLHFLTWVFPWDLPQHSPLEESPLTPRLRYGFRQSTVRLSPSWVTSFRLPPLSAKYIFCWQM